MANTENADIQIYQIPELSTGLSQSDLLAIDHLQGQDYITHSVAISAFDDRYVKANRLVKTTRATYDYLSATRQIDVSSVYFIIDDND